MKSNQIYILSLLILISFTFNSCKKDDVSTPEDGIILSSNTVIIENNDWESNIINIDPTDYTFTFSKGILNNYNLATGDIMVSQKDGGYLRKVTAVYDDGANIIVKTDFASVTDAFEQGEGKIENQYLTPDFESDSMWFADGVELLTKKSTKGTNKPDDLSISFGVNSVLYDFDKDLDTKSDQIRVEGRYSLITKVGMEVNIKKFKLDYLQLNYELKKEDKVKSYIGLALGNSINIEKVISKIPCGTYIVGPVVISPVIETKVGVIIGGSASLTIESSSTETNFVNLVYDEKKWDATHWNEIEEKAFEHEIEGKVEAKVYIKSTVKFKVYEVVSPYVSAEAYIKGKVELGTDKGLNWELKTGQKIKLGVNMKILSKMLLDYNAEVYKHENTLLTGSFTNKQNKPTAAFTCTPTTGTTETVFAFDASSSSDIEDPVNDLKARWDFENDGIWDTGYSYDKTQNHQYTNAGTYTVNLEIIDTDGLDSLVSHEIVVTDVSSGLPSLTTNSISNITQNTATSGGNITADGGATVTARGVCWATSSNPTTANSHTSDGSGTGSFTSSITGLAAGTTYYVRSYATNSQGTAYGNQQTFTTTNATGLPSLTTTTTSNISQTTATSGGNITADGGATVTARGICWATSSNPTTANSHTSDGSGTGSFTSSITGLAAGTTYYVRAYATNSQGTAYGNQQSFTTSSSTLETGTVTDYDGNTYNTVKIGNQWWMAENLKVTHYANGTAIPLVTDNMAWSNLGINDKAYCYYNNSNTNRDTYGALYTWAAASNGIGSSTNPSGVQGVCPTGWHLPSNAEWTELTDYLTNNGYGYGGSGSDIGKAMAATSGWRNSNKVGDVGNEQGTNNSSGFTALPGGCRTSGGGSFHFIGKYGNWWSSTPGGSEDAWRRDLDYDGGEVFRYGGYRAHGYSVRCIKD